MIHKQIVEVPACTKEVESHRTCDLCGVDTQSSRSEIIEHVEVGCRFGETFGEYGAEITKLEVDLCVSCFRTRFVPWLREQGAAVREIDGSY